MSEHLDAAISAIDDLLNNPTQTAGDDAYPTERGEQAVGKCWRCCRNDAVTEAELCAGCKSFLLEDTDEDPIEAQTLPAPRVQGDYVMDTILDVRDYLERHMRTIEALRPVDRWVLESSTHGLSCAMCRDVLDEAWQRVEDHALPPGTDRFGWQRAETDGNQPLRFTDEGTMAVVPVWHSVVLRYEGPPPGSFAEQVESLGRRMREAVIPPMEAFGEQMESVRNALEGQMIDRAWFDEFAEWMAEGERAEVEPVLSPVEQARVRRERLRAERERGLPQLSERNRNRRNR